MARRGSVQPLILELPVESESVGAARRSVGAFAERAGAVRHDVELAVSEAVTNSVVHGYPTGVQGTILVRAELAGNRLHVSVNDDGTGLRPNIRSHGLGVGLPLIARVSESYRIEDGHDSGAVITMTFLTGRAL